MILNYRDPRDVLLSLVDFFSRNNGLRFRRFPETAIFGPVLESIQDPAAKIDYALSDPAMPLLGDYESAISFLHHPNVCTVSFEELVGPPGRRRPPDPARRRPPGRRVAGPGRRRGRGGGGTLHPPAPSP
ncbi:hypothetical protein GCM10020254_01060 [Streptomyces goshikiensis]